MTSSEARRPGIALRGSRAPAAFFALLAIAGGIVEGAFFGSFFALIAFLPPQLFDPSSAGGTGSAGLTSTALLIGAAVGAVSGGFLAVPAALGLLLAWALRLAAPWAVGLASAGLVLGLWAYLFVLFPPDPQLIALAAAALLHAVAGLVVIDGLGRRWPDAQRPGPRRQDRKRPEPPHPRPPQAGPPHPGPRWPDAQGQGSIR
ncbi:hypothetical protein [Herbiconiux flava]|uniref:Uncharacterized protein n=1 Tax=Herbiconiux flava TaxID=881268 RepID=A0A852SQT4_9MICO|nr:hypothetical protein [Herbiconiux flava]NYD71080.1 hypothetical protein [Herbiconiux flava]GLK18958.1 hypothetical protein GCM10017602_34400 [Herbiconiux flava]